MEPKIKPWNHGSEPAQTNRGTKKPWNLISRQNRTMEPKCNRGSEPAQTNHGTKKPWEANFPSKIKPWNQNATVVRNQLRQTVEQKKHGT